MYDLVDSLVADLSKMLHQSQMEDYQNLEQKLASIRRQAIEAETLDLSVQKFVSTVQQAFQQTFGGSNEK